jgi:MFS family permease
MERVSLLPRIDGLPRAYWFLWGGALVNRLGSFVIPFLSIYLTGERHLSPAEAGLVVSLWGAGSLGAGPVGGFIADRWGRRSALVLSLSMGASAMLALGFARSIPEIIAATFALGFFGEMYRPSVTAAIGDLVAPQDRTRAFGFLYWAINLGFSIAPVVASLMVKRGFVTLFVADAATTLAFAAIVYLRVPETRPENRDLGEELLGGRWTAPYTDDLFLAFMLISFLGALMFVQHLVALPLDMAAHGIDAAHFGRIICINGILIVLVQPPAAQWLENFDKGRVLAVGALLVGVGFGLNAFAHTPWQYAGAIAVWSLGEIALLPVAVSVITELAPAPLRASYQGAYQLVWGASFLITPALSGSLMARFGARALWIGCFVVGGVVAAGHLWHGAARRRRVARTDRLAA